MSQKYIDDRLKFEELLQKSAHLSEKRLGEELRSHILWTDESIIELYPKLNQQNVRYRTENKSDVPSRAIPKFGLKVMVAGGFCARCVTPLHIIPKGQSVNAKHYMEKILPIYFDSMGNKEIFPNERKIVFMQDGAIAHTAKASLSLIKTQVSTVWSKGVWAANGPDLNPLKNQWSILKENVYKEPQPRTREELMINWTAVISCGYVMIRSMNQKFLDEFPAILTYPFGVIVCGSCGYGMLQMAAEMFDIATSFLNSWSQTRHKNLRRILTSCATLRIQVGRFYFVTVSTTITYFQKTFDYIVDCIITFP
ncbi:Transposable element Tc1 transposase [Folsomia candida]|uniref:Transposable element Tc1 transposase n=1 Tax=Folsomia candida TaxID=158441 RepID=A0A226CZ62_FOLCA|nr:Transposable element Tc1 transposase [Folsomia candida]